MNASRSPSAQPLTGPPPVLSLLLLSPGPLLLDPLVLVPSSTGPVLVLVLPVAALVPAVVSGSPVVESPRVSAAVVDDDEDEELEPVSSTTSGGRFDPLQAKSSTITLGRKGAGPGRMR